MSADGEDNRRLLGELATARERIQELETSLGRHSDPTPTRPAPPTSSLGQAFSEALADSLPGILYLFDANAHLLWWNKQFEELTGYSPTELAGTRLDQFVSPEARPLILSWFQTVLDSSSSVIEVPLVLKNGVQMPHVFTGHRMEFSGAPCLIGMGIEVGERQLGERRRLVRLAVPQVLATTDDLAAAAPQVLQAIAEGLGWDLGLLWLVDSQAQVLRCIGAWCGPSTAAIEFINVSRQRTFASGVGLPGRVWETARPAWIPDVVDDANFPRMRLAQAEGLHGAIAYPIVAGNDVMGVLEFFSRDVREPDADLLETIATVGGQVGQFLQRRRAEDELRRSEARKGAMLAAALDAIITIDHDERILEFNPAAEKILGHASSAVLGLKLSELIIPHPYREAHRQGMRNYLATGVGPVLGRRVEMSALRADGSEFPVEISIVPTVLGDRPIFTGYLRDITERKRAEREVRQLNRELEDRVLQRTAELNTANSELARAAKLKDEFLATISHELRTPLGGVLGMVDLLADSPLNEKQRHYTQVARVSADLLRDVINDILDFSRIEAGQLQLERVDFNPAEVVHEVMSVLSLQAAKKGIDLRSHLANGVDLLVSGDRSRLRQVLLNLVSNAVKFTEHGEVTIEVEVVNCEVEDLHPPTMCNLRFAVKDTGIGIPNDRLDRLFQPFSQVDASTSRRYGGSGLGLAICRQLTELMGGTIGVNTEPGHGSTFWFVVPLNPPLKAQLSLDRSSPSASDVALASRSLRILLAEDNEANQLVATALLESAGHSVRVVNDGRQALAAHAEERFDLILMDVQMPEVDGLQATLEIRRREALQGPRTPIVAVTAHAGKRDQERFLEGGMDGCLTKPLVRRELAAVLKGLFSANIAFSALPAAPSTQTDQGGVDWNQVSERLENNEELLVELINLYIRDWPRLFTELRVALDEGEFGVVAFKAHRLNGLARNFGVGPAAIAAAELEALAKGGQSEAIHRACNELKEALAQLERDVSRRA